MARLLAERGVTAEEDFIAVAKDANLRSRHFTDPVPKEVEFKWEGLFSLIHIPFCPIHRPNKLVNECFSAWKKSGIKKARD